MIAIVRVAVIVVVVVVMNWFDSDSCNLREIRLDLFKVSHSTVPLAIPTTTSTRVNTTRNVPPAHTAATIIVLPGPYYTTTTTRVLPVLPYTTTTTVASMTTLYCYYHSGFCDYLHQSHPNRNLYSK